ncbi:hypothetical protein FVA74_07850 [Salinibacterium sp. dk2585]|uniref:DUF6993 domain-containing protein n=1 Tax=unclassified Salinibacterium TaxID=2632331 RepID=UPI0011C2494A|nr:MULTISPECIES: hypothetical protein [unclassified Salinibacterium]QEE61498.1 hypothetical protein FVA74_07850 [Salinibacterium sp. dk2585]TXK54175.1 hypothetical protein FVP63_09300 [Salinibacterium sp. dk5596]
MRTPRRGVLALTAVAVAFALAGCASEAPTPSPSPRPTASPSVEPAPPPTFDPEAGASDNRAYFDEVVRGHIEAGGDMSNATIISLLTSAGWTAAQLEVTPDGTPLGNATDALSFAALMGEKCIVGQWNGEYTSTVVPVLSSGTCLIGTPHRVG